MSRVRASCRANVSPSRARTGHGRGSKADAESTRLAIKPAQEPYDAQPNRQMMHSDTRVHDIYHRSLRDGCRADAIEEALQRHFVELAVA
jgi:hypothetical protein